MIFRAEKDVRRWLREKFKDVWWIEGKAGSTVGLPDAFLIQDGLVLFVELKLAEKVGDWFEFYMRPAQARQIEKIVRLGGRVLIIAGIKETSDVGVLNCSQKGRMVDPPGRWRIDLWDMVFN